MVPVQMPEQDRATEWLALEQCGDAANAGSGVKDQRWRLSVMTQGHARRMTPVADELGPRCGRRTPNTADEYPHRLMARTVSQR